jgi:hypothetical protein
VYAIHTPPWDAFSQNATVHFGIYGVPTELDAAGTVTKRENFEWTFKFTSREKSEQAQIAVSQQHMTESEANACR